LEKAVPRRAVAVLLLAAVLFSTVSAAASASLRLGLLAVKETDNGFEGVVISAELSLGPGNGSVVVGPPGMVDESTVYSTRVGFMLAAALAGKSYDTMSLRLRFETSTPVGGPSASGFIASSLLLLALGLAPDTDNATMTGMVSPSGLVLAVAGVSAKARAAAAKGYRLIVVPGIEDSEALQRAAKGARVVAACSILDAAEALSGEKLPLPSTEPPAPPVPRVFSRDAKRFINYTEKLLPLLPNKTRARVDGLLERARQVLETDPYSAASFAFTALLNAANATIASKGFEFLEEKLNITMDKALAEAEKAIQSTTFGSGEICDTWRFAALSAASYRLYLAKHVSKQATPRSEALALLRAISAKTWAEAARELHGPRVPCSYLEEATNRTLEYAGVSLRYLISLLQKPEVKIMTSLADNRTMSDWLRDARDAARRGDYPLAMGLAVYVLSEIEYRMDVVNTMPGCIAGYWSRLAAIAGPAFMVPSSYYHGYAARQGNATKGPEAAARISLEAAALAWLIPGIFLHTVAQAGQHAAAAATAQPPTLLQEEWLPYAVLVLEASLLAVAGGAAAAAARRLTA
jgi:uncharacterized protein